jgi:hypothetical protein
MLDAAEGAESIVEEERAWEVLLRTPRQKKKWAQVQTIRRALESVGGRCRVARLLPAVQLLDGSFKESQLRTILARDGHFEADNSRRYKWQPCPPSSCAWRSAPLMARVARSVSQGLEPRQDFDTGEIQNNFLGRA